MGYAALVFSAPLELKTFQGRSEMDILTREKNKENRLTCYRLFKEVYFPCMLIKDHIFEHCGRHLINP
jgi:hypothetical protein